MAFVIDGSGKVHHGGFCEYMEAKLAALTEDAPETSRPAGKRAVAARYFEQQHGAAPAVTAVEAPELPERAVEVIEVVDAYAGEIKRAFNRQTKSLIVVFDAHAQGLDTDGGRWYTECVDHGVHVAHRTRALALSHSAAPAGWCEGCRKGVEAREQGRLRLEAPRIIVQVPNPGPETLSQRIASMAARQVR